MANSVRGPCHHDNLACHSELVEGIGRRVGDRPGEPVPRLHAVGYGHRHFEIGFGGFWSAFQVGGAYIEQLGLLRSVEQSEKNSMSGIFRSC